MVQILLTNTQNLFVIFLFKKWGNKLEQMSYPIYERKQAPEILTSSARSVFYLIWHASRIIQDRTDPVKE